MGDIGKSTGGRVVVVVHHQTSGRNVEVDGMHERTGRETMTFRHHEQLLLASPTMVRTIRFRPCSRVTHRPGPNATGSSLALPP